MATFYTGVDKERYDAGNKFVPMDQFLLDYTTPTTNVEEEEVTTSYGIPNTNAFVNSGGGNNVGPFDPYTAQSPTSYITNRSSIGNTGYLQGTEPEETYMDKIGGLIKKGIGMAIPGGNFLMGMADNLSRENRLNAFDNAFIDMQLANQEQNIHGFGNLTNQDRYGYNKVSMFGNYADVIAERVAIAKERIAAGKELRDIDRYYMEKEKEQDEIEKQVDFNNFLNQRITANKIREGIEKGTIKEDFNIHGDGDNKNITTNQNQTGGGDGYTGSGDFSNIDNSGKNYGPHKDSWSGGSGNQGTTPGAGLHADYNQGGRVGLRYGGLLSIL